MVHARQKSPRACFCSSRSWHRRYDIYGAILWSEDMNYEGEEILERKPRFFTHHQGINNTPLAEAGAMWSDAIARMSQHARDCTKRAWVNDTCVTGWTYEERMKRVKLEKRKKHWKKIHRVWNDILPHFTFVSRLKWKDLVSSWQINWIKIIYT